MCTICGALDTPTSAAHIPGSYGQIVSWGPPASCGAFPCRERGAPLLLAFLELDEIFLPFPPQGNVAFGSWCCFPFCGINPTLMWLQSDHTRSVSGWVALEGPEQGRTAGHQPYSFARRSLVGVFSPQQGREISTSLSVSLKGRFACLPTFTCTWFLLLMKEIKEISWLRKSIIINKCVFFYDADTWPVHSS